MAMTAMKEKIQRKNPIGKINFDAIKLLKRFQLENNNRLKELGIQCNLIPDKNKESCKACPNFDDCKHFEWERNYLRKEDSKNANKRRNKKKGHFKRNVEASYSEFDDNYENDEMENKFPCGDMNFACPDHEVCMGGKNCPWEP